MARKVFAAFDRGQVPTISLLDLTQDPAVAARLPKLLPALQTYVDKHFGPVWGFTAQLKLASGTKLPPKTWGLVFARNADEADALGYHELTKNGMPISYVFTETSKLAGEDWATTASHEVAEMAIDPAINLWVDDGTKLWAYETCLTGDTRIPLLDGTEVPIQELVGREDFYLYSLDEDAQLRPGRGHSARCTQRDAEIIEVELDNGEVLRCTPDHKMLLRDGTYCPAGSLQTGDSLMPLYRRRERLEGTNLDYEQTFQPADQMWVFTHRFVEPRCPRGYYRHHRDFNRFNNDPNNLELLTFAQHTAVHAAHARELNARKLAEGTHAFQQPKSAKHRAKLSEQMCQLNAGHQGQTRPEVSAGQLASEIMHSPKTIERLSRQGTANITQYNKSEAHRKIAGELGRKSLAKLRTDPTYVAMMQEVMARRNLQTNHNRWHVRRGKPNPTCELCAVELAVNHKVVAVRAGGRADVYDLTVDRYHNFATSVGVFVHNCDAVEATTFKVAGFPMSNFLYPAAFESFRKPKSTQFDHLSLTSRPFQLLKGGYSIVMRNGQVSQVFGSRAKRGAFGNEDRRLHRSQQRLGLL